MVINTKEKLYSSEGETLMSKNFQASLLFAFIGISLLSFPAKAMLEEDELNKKSYIVVRTWLPEKGKYVPLPHYAKHAASAYFNEFVGHASIEIIKDKFSTYISFWPAKGLRSASIGVDCKFHTYKDDKKEEGRREDQAVKLYSLNGQKIGSYFEKKIKYEEHDFVLVPNNNNGHNCSSISLKLLKKGGVDSIFSAESTFSTSNACRAFYNPFFTTDYTRSSVTPSHIFDIAYYASWIETDLFPKTKKWKEPNSRSGSKKSSSSKKKILK